MKNKSIKNIITIALIITIILSVVPVQVSGEWRQDEIGWWYSTGDDCLIGWENVEGSWYYFNNDGYMQIGWLKDGSAWYYLKSNGAMATTGMIIDGKLSDFYSNGIWRGFIEE